MRSGFRNRPCTVPVPPQAGVRDRAAGRRSKTCVIAWHSESGLPAASKAALRDMALPVLGRWHPCFHSLRVPAVRFLFHADHAHGRLHSTTRFMSLHCGAMLHAHIQSSQSYPHHAARPACSQHPTRPLSFNALLLAASTVSPWLPKMRHPAVWRYVRCCAAASVGTYTVCRQIMKSIEMNEERYIALLRKLIGESERVQVQCNLGTVLMVMGGDMLFRQNAPPDFNPREDCVSDHVLEALRPHTVRSCVSRPVLSLFHRCNTCLPSGTGRERRPSGCGAHPLRRGTWQCDREVPRHLGNRDCGHRGQVCSYPARALRRLGSA